MLKKDFKLCYLLGTINRTFGGRLHKVRALQQGERAKVESIQRENGLGKRMELPHLAVQRAKQVSYPTCS